jgi:TonB family protein
VTSISGEPLFGVLLYVGESNQMTTSDEDGRFELFLPNPESEIVVNYAGYETEIFTVHQGEEQLELKLAEANNLLEAVVVGKGGRNRKLQQAAPKMDTMPVQDSGLQDNKENLKFIEYLKSHSRFPLAEATFNSAKMVTLDFLIDDKGKPGLVQIVNSSGNKDMDDEAIRLIRKGPDWECVEGAYPCRGRYSIYFK